MPRLERCTRALLAGILLIALAGCGGSSSSSSEERVVYADGITLHLARFDGTTLVDIDTASIPSAGLLDGHAIFGMVKHPTKQLLYVTSENDCFADVAWCWGNARIDRFSVGKGSISYDGPAFLYDDTATLASCAAKLSEYEGQVGYCAPVNAVFSLGGSRLYVQDDDNDVLQIFEVNADNTLTMLDEGADTDLHGLAMSPTQPYVYNGTSVLGVDGDAASVVLGGSGGNDTLVVSPPTGDDVLVTTLSTSGIGVYSLADPAAPSEIDTLSIGSNRARAFAVNAALTGAIVVGRDTVSTVGFDGTTLLAGDTVDLSGGAEYVENRSVAVLADEAHALVSWFQVSEANASGWIGGVSVYTVDDAGALTPGATVALDRASRVVRVMKLK